jgi:hypothetical protein
MTALDMQPLQARFATQDQAEAAMRKLAALRSDRFRLERAGAGTAGEAFASAEMQQPSQDAAIDGLAASVMEAGSAIQASAGVMASTDVTAWGVTPQSSGLVAEFTLSANVPDSATEQARTVIQQAGGELI